jgi:hypothetical protein
MCSTIFPNPALVYINCFPERMKFFTYLYEEITNYPAEKNSKIKIEALAGTSILINKIKITKHN